VSLVSKGAHWPWEPNPVCRSTPSMLGSVGVAETMSWSKTSSQVDTVSDSDLFIIRRLGWESIPTPPSCQLRVPTLLCFKIDPLWHVRYTMFSMMTPFKYYYFLFKNCVKGEQCVPKLQSRVSCATHRSWDSRVGTQGCRVQILISNWKSELIKL
jgi:hypothetical protein